MTTAVNLHRFTCVYSVICGVHMAALGKSCEKIGLQIEWQRKKKLRCRSWRKLRTEGSGCDMLIAPLQSGSGESCHPVGSKTAWESYLLSSSFTPEG